MEYSKLLESKKIAYSVVDAASPEDRIWAKKLRAISTKEFYPQLFSSDGGGDFLFQGGYQELADMVEDNSYKVMLGLETAKDDGKGPKIVNDEVDEMTAASHRNKKNVAKEFKELDKYKGSKIWNLSDKEKEELWKAIDTDGQGTLDPSEMQDFAAAFWEAQMARGDVRKEWMIEGTHTAEHHIRLLRESLQAHLDLDHDGKITKAEFVKHWNAVARSAFSGSASCCVIL